MSQELMSDRFQKHGDSPTVKTYTEWSIYRSVFEKLFRKELDLIDGTTVKISGNAFVKGTSTASFYDAHSLLPKIHKSLSDKAEVVVFQGGEARVEIDSGEIDGVLVVNLIVDASSNGTLIIESGNRIRNGAYLLNVNMIVRENSRINVLLSLDDSLGSISSLNLIAESEKNSKSNIVSLVNPGRMSRVDGLLKPGEDSLMRIRLTGVARENTQFDAVIDGLLDKAHSSLDLYSTMYLKSTAVGSVRGKGIVTPRAENARIVYGLESILEEEAVAFMQPFLEVNSNRVLEARHYARNYLVTYDKLFYMASRGLSFEEARGLVLTGLLTSSIPVELKNYCYWKITRRLN